MQTLAKMAISHTSLSAILRIERGHIQSHKKRGSLKMREYQNKKNILFDRLLFFFIAFMELFFRSSM